MSQPASIDFWFAVGQEIFWGDDRLDDAIGWLGRATTP